MAIIDRGRSAFRANQKATKTQNAEYEKRLWAIRDRFPVGTVINLEFLHTNFSDFFQKSRPHLGQVFLDAAKKKEHLGPSGKLLPWGLRREDFPVATPPPKPPDQNSGRVIRRDKYPSYAMAFYTEGEKHFKKWDRFTAGNLGERVPKFAGCDPASIGEFLVYLRDRDPRKHKKPEVIKNGDGTWSLTDEGLRIQDELRNTIKQTRVVATPAPSPPPLAAPAVVAVALVAPAPPATVDVDVTENEEDEAVVEAVAGDEYGRNPRKLPRIGIGPVPTGKHFTTKDRRALGMLILSVVKVAGGTGRKTCSANLFPQVRQLCELGSEVRAATIGMFFRTLWNFSLVESWGDHDGFEFQVKPEVYTRVLEGEFGELPFEKFGLGADLSVIPPLTQPSKSQGVQMGRPNFFSHMENSVRALGVLLRLAGQDGWVRMGQFTAGLRQEFKWSADSSDYNNLPRTLQRWAEKYVELEMDDTAVKGNLAYRITTNGCDLLKVAYPSWAMTYKLDGDLYTLVKPTSVPIESTVPAAPLEPVAPVPEAEVEEEETEVTNSPLASEVHDKRPPNAWDLRRYERSARYYARLFRICEREGILSINASSARRVYNELGENTSGKFLTKVYQQVMSGPRIFQFIDQETKAWNFWFVDDFVKKVHSGLYDEVSADPEPSTRVTTEPPVPLAPPEPIVEPVQATPELVRPSERTRRVLTRRGGVPLEVYQAALEQLKASREAVEALKTTVAGLSEQIGAIVEQALRRQADGFTTQFTELRKRLDAAESRMDKHLAK